MPFPDPQTEEKLRLLAIENTRLKSENADLRASSVRQQRELGIFAYNLVKTQQALKIEVVESTMLREALDSALQEINDELAKHDKTLPQETKAPSNSNATLAKANGKTYQPGQGASVETSRVIGRNS